MLQSGDSMASPAKVAQPREPIAMAAPRFYRPELDCLRFLAFFGVFLCHTLSGDPHYYRARHVPFPNLIASAAFAGRYGVDLFFLLSAYLITELLLREREEFGKLDLRSFYIRRILRIWPLYFLAIAIGIGLSRVDPNEKFPLSYVAAFALLYGNWMISLKGSVPTVVFSLWSVSFEEQFYVLWPAMISGTRNRAILRVGAGLLLVASVSRFILFGRAQSMHSEMTIFTNTFTRLDPLALGIGAAAMLRGKRFQLPGSTRILMLVTGYSLWMMAAHYCGVDLPYVLFGYPAVAIGALLIFLAVLGAGFAPGWLRYLGKISYGLYVFHGIALYLAVRILGGYAHTPRQFLAYWWLGLALTTALAAFSYRFLEAPFLRLKEHFSRVKSRPV
jgi:peptidoglycan/LPS O-acetylase OafA/YrhL